MALIKCEECGHDVSTKAANCPNCGAPIMEPDIPSDTDTETNKPPAQKTSAVTYAARTYFVGGFVVLLLIGPWIGWYALGNFVGEWLFLGLGIALLAYGYSRSSRDWIRTGVIAVGWPYTVVIAIAIFNLELLS